MGVGKNLTVGRHFSEVAIASGSLESWQPGSLMDYPTGCIHSACASTASRGRMQKNSCAWSYRFLHPHPTRPTHRFLLQHPSRQSCPSQPRRHTRPGHPCKRRSRVPPKPRFHRVHFQHSPGHFSPPRDLNLFYRNLIGLQNLAGLPDLSRQVISRDL